MSKLPRKCDNASYLLKHGLSYLLSENQDEKDHGGQGKEHGEIQDLDLRIRKPLRSTILSEFD